MQTITVPVNYLIFAFLLDDGALAWAGLPDVDLRFLGLVSYIGVIAALAIIYALCYVVPGSIYVVFRWLGLPAACGVVAVWALLPGMYVFLKIYWQSNLRL